MIKFAISYYICKELFDTTRDHWIETKGLSQSFNLVQITKEYRNILCIQMYFVIDVDVKSIFRHKL